MDKIDQIKNLRESASRAAKDPAFRSKAADIGRDIATAAVEGAKLKKRTGEVSKIRVLRAVAMPADSARRVARAAGGEAIRQVRAAMAAESGGESTSQRYLRSAPPGQRKDMLAFACIHRIAELPLCSKPYLGHPVSDRYGLKEAVQVVRSVLHQDRSLNAWTTRSALVALDVVLESVNGGKWDQNLDGVMEAMGLEEGPSLQRELANSIPAHEAEQIVGLAHYSMALYWCVCRLFSEAGKKPDRSLYKRLFESDNAGTVQVSFEIIAWTCVAIGRLHTLYGIPANVGWFSDSSRTNVIGMEQPGWYPNPYNIGDVIGDDCTFQRYWNGEDWTDQIRLKADGKWLTQTHSLRSVPDN